MMPPTAPPPVVLQAPADPSPVQALVERTGERVHIRLIAMAPKHLDVRYTLTLTAGSNRTKQGGSVQIAPNLAVTVLDLTQSPAGRWSGLLDVQVVGGRAYHVILGEDAAPIG